MANSEWCCSSVGCLLLQRTNERPQHLSDRLALLQRHSRFFRGQKSDTLRKQKMCLHLFQRTLRNPKKLDEAASLLPTMPFCNVGRHRGCGASDLSGHSEL